MFNMDSKSQFTVDIISKVIDGKITINHATHLLLGHAKLESTMNNLGVEIENTLRISDGYET